ncbi:MAG: DUF4369 domain-containing protein [Bacteroidales bacterium]|nr:DUF4369 domain-containing protein [Bacteroidales bacterium]
MNILRNLIIAFGIILFSINSFAQQSNNYNIKVKVDNCEDKQLILVTYYRSSNKIVDTAFVNSKGEYVFSGDEALIGGMYLILFEDKRYFEIIIDKDQDFSLQTNTDDFVANMKVKGSKDNTDFYNLMIHMNSLHEKRMPLDKEIKDSTTTEARKKELKKELMDLGKEADNYRVKYMDENPEALFTIILKASKEPEIPKVLPKKEDGTNDSTYIYKYYRAHFFDNFDFADERLLHTRFYAQKIKKYWTQVIPQNPDTLTTEAIRIIELSKTNKETYMYNIWYFTYASETSNIMGMDAVFVALGKKYYLSGEAFWVNKTVLKNMTDRINTLDQLLIGRTAPNLIMQDTAFILRSLHDIEANYTIVMFWDPDCGHCKHEIPRVKKWVDDNGDKYGVKVFSICSDTNVVKWKKSIKTFKIESWINVDGPRSLTPNYHDLYDIISTPVIYLLDDKKRILAKRLSDAQVHSFIERDFKQKAKEKEKE